MKVRPSVSRHREELTLDVAVGERVGPLQGDEGRPAAQLGERHRLRDHPRGRVRDADVQDLPGRHEIVERAHDLGDGRHPVPHVQPQEVDVVGAQPTQARLERLHEVLAVVAARIRVVAVRGERVLRRDDEAIARRLDEGADDRLALTVRVVAGGVDEVPARVDERLEHAAALVLRGAPAPGLAEGHRSERDLRDPETAPAEQCVAHHSSSVPMMSATSVAASSAAARPRDVRVGACVSLERDETRVAELREVVVHRGAREPGRVDQVGGPPDATTHESEDLHPLRIRERPAERDETVLARAVRRGQVRDETRRAVLGEHERRRRLEVGDEDDALGLGLRDVAVSGRDVLDGRERRLRVERRGRPLVGGVQLARGGRLEQRGRSGGQRGGDPLLRRGRVEREQDAERGPRVASVVARLREESCDRGSVTARRRLDVVDACERAPRPRVATEEVAPELDGSHRLDGCDEALRSEGCARVERDSEKVEPRLAFAVAYRRERSCELVRLVAT